MVYTCWWETLEVEPGSPSPSWGTGRPGWGCTNRTVLARGHLLLLKATPQKATVVTLLWCAQHHIESWATLRKLQGWWKKSTEKHCYLSWGRSSYMHSWINAFYLGITTIFVSVLSCSKNFCKWKNTKLEQCFFSMLMWNTGIWKQMIS